MPFGGDKKADRRPAVRIFEAQVRVLESAPDDTIYCVPARRDHETDQEWFSRFVVIRNIGKAEGKPSCTCLQFAVHRDCPDHGFMFEERKANRGEALARNPLQPTPEGKKV